MKNRRIAYLLLSIFLVLSIVGCSNGNYETTGYNISGQVVDSLNSGIENVSIYNNEDKITQTDVDGEFSKTNLQNSVVLEPVKQGYSFNPEEKYVASTRNDIKFTGEHIGNLNGELKVHFIDIGQGDAILIQTPEGKNMLIDGGDRFDWVADRLTGYLREQEVDTVHAIVGTHPHADHIGGLAAVIEQFEVETVYDSGRVHTTMTYENYLRLIDENDIPFRTPRRGEEIQLGSLNFEVLHPGSDVESYSLNDASIVLRLEYGDVSFLFTGDAEKRAEEEMLSSGLELEANIFKVAHHGSSSSTIPQFLEEIAPEVAVIQVGEDNRYGHPTDEVIDRLANAGVEIYRNDFQGNIVVTTDGTSYSVNEEPYDPGDREEETSDKININTADHETLQEITGVGPTIAERIIEYRQTYGNFNTIEEIKEVSGIGEARFKDMRDEITI